MEPRQSLQTGQHLAISPALYQSLNILRLSATQLRELIQRELEQNPTLELPEAAQPGVELGSSDVATAPGEDLWRDLESTGGGGAAGRRDPLRTDPGAGAELASAPVTLTEHLTTQLNLSDLTGAGRHCALAVIGSLDDDGYLREEVADIAATISRSAAQIEAAVKVVQGFDPPGIAARDLQECLAIQLRQMDAPELAESIVRECLPLLARGDLKKISRQLDAPMASVEAAVEIIRSLDPSPGSRFDSTPPAAPAIPDIYVDNVNGDISVLPNREVQPSLRVSALYREMAEAAKNGGSEPGGGKADPETAAYIRTRIAEAVALIRGIEQRGTTVVSVARAIAAAQPDFFKSGSAALRPLKLSDVAAALGVHPSTVSRAIMGKYMSTPHGIFEFRYFFSTGFESGVRDVAATAVKKRIQGIIAGEDGEHPLSDQKLTDLLKKDGIPISRRTVAKYREELGIAASWDRRRTR